MGQCVIDSFRLEIAIALTKLVSLFIKCLCYSIISLVALLLRLEIPNEFIKVLIDQKPLYVFVFENQDSAQSVPLWSIVGEIYIVK